MDSNSILSTNQAVRRKNIFGAGFRTRRCWVICSPLHLLVTYSVMLESRTCWNRFESRSFLPVSRKIKPHHHHHHTQHHPTATSLLNIRLSCPRGNNLSWLRPCNGSSHLLSFHCGDKLIFIVVIRISTIVRSKSYQT